MAEGSHLKAHLVLENQLGNSVTWLLITEYPHNMAAGFLRTNKPREGEAETAVFFRTVTQK